MGNLSSGVMLTRRAWLAVTLAGVAGLRAHAADDEGTAPAVEAAQARKAGLAPFESSQTAHFLGIGDGPGPYRKKALGICRELADAYLKHFRDKGFTALRMPEHRLTVVTLRDRASYEKFEGEAAGPDVGGHYDLDANRLVIYDFSGKGDEPIANAMRVNTFTLIHECLHLLTFNTGLLNRKGDVPRAISEGLAAYGEMWRPPSIQRTPFGLRNAPRGDELAKHKNLAQDWVPVDRLLTQDALFDNEATAQRAYAQSWLLIHYLMRSTPARLRGFRAYLGAIHDRADASQRIDDAATHLGDLDRLDQDLRRHLRRALEGRN